MIELGNIISAIIGALGGGGISWIFFFRANKGSATADAVTKAADAMQKLLANIDQQQDVHNEVIKQKDKSIADLNEIIERYKLQLEQYEQKIKELTYTFTENQRKIEGMQKLLDKELGNEKYAERIICLDEACKLRKPKIGTFKTEGQ